MDSSVDIFIHFSAGKGKKIAALIPRRVGPLHPGRERILGSKANLDSLLLIPTITFY